MTAEQAATHPSRNVISRALGAESTVDIDMKTIMVEPNTSFVLCSDGITRHVDDWELESLLRSDPDLEEVCRRLKSICYDRGAEDNLTAVVVKVTGDAVVQQEQPTPLEIADVEEDTVTTARSPFDDVAEPLSLLPVTENFTYEPDVTGETEEILDLGGPEPLISVPLMTESPEELPTTKTDEAATPLLIEPEKVEPVQAEQAAVVEAPALVEPRKVEPRKVEPVYQPIEQETASGGGLFGGFLTSLLMLVVGAAVGALGMYFLFLPRTIEPQQQQQQTPVLVPKSDNQPRATFEEGRRWVDSDPTAYLSANKAFEPDADAADFYLRGRAFLRLGNYFEAKQALTEAKKRLKPNDDDAATLDTEIALALAVINSGPATESLRKDLTDWANAAPANTAANSNSSNSNNAVGTGNSATSNQQVNSNR
jgi:hypothetical protein